MKEEVIIESDFDVQDSNLGIEFGKESFNIKILVARERSLEELDKKLEELQKETEDDILEFAGGMNLENCFIKQVAKICLLLNLYQTTL